MADLEAVLEKGRCSCGHSIGWHEARCRRSGCECTLAEHQAQATAVRAWLAEVMLSEAGRHAAAKAIHAEFCGCEPGEHGTSYREGATAALQAAVEVLGVRGE